jgi:outer membrane lipoprotein-sorting protein
MISGAGRTTRIVQAAGLLLLIGAPRAAEVQPWDFAQLMGELAKIESSRARYSEVRHVAQLKRPIQLSGTLTYSRPARIEKRQTRPFPEVMRVDGDMLVMEREGKSRSIMLSQVPVVGTLVESLRATLAGDATELDRLYAVTMEGPRERWTLKLLPREYEVAGIVSQISISGSGSRVNRVEIRELSGDRSVMTIQEDS